MEVVPEIFKSQLKRLQAQVDENKDELAKVVSEAGDKILKNDGNPVSLEQAFPSKHDQEIKSIIAKTNLILRSFLS